MIASLNQRPSSAWSNAISKSGRTFIGVYSRIAAEYEDRLGGIDAQADSAPLEHVPFTGDEVLDHAHAAAGVLRADLLGAEMQPELLRPGGERDRAGDRVVIVLRFFQEAGDV